MGVRIPFYLIMVNYRAISEELRKFNGDSLIDRIRFDIKFELLIEVVVGYA